jgi:hypothetical protein
MSEREDVVETVDVQTEAVATQPTANSQGDPSGGDRPIADLGKVRELVLKAHPDVVPDLVVGSSVDELIASVEPARTAYQRIADQVRMTGSGVGGPLPLAESEVSSDVRRPTSDPIAVQPPVVPAGGATNVAEPGDLGPTTKIAQALAARRTKAGSR